MLARTWGSVGLQSCGDFFIEGARIYVKKCARIWGNLLTLARIWENPLSRVRGRVHEGVPQTPVRVLGRWVYLKMFHVKRERMFTTQPSQSAQNVLCSHLYKLLHRLNMNTMHCTCLVL